MYVFLCKMWFAYTCIINNVSFTFHLIQIFTTKSCTTIWKLIKFKLYFFKIHLSVIWAFAFINWIKVRSGKGVVYQLSCSPWFIIRINRPGLLFVELLHILKKTPPKPIKPASIPSKGRWTTNASYHQTTSLSIICNHSIWYMWNTFPCHHQEVWWLTCYGLFEQSKHAVGSDVQSQVL